VNPAVQLKYFGSKTNSAAHAGLKSNYSLAYIHVLCAVQSDEHALVACGLNCIVGLTAKLRSRYRVVHVTLTKFIKPKLFPSLPKGGGYFILYQTLMIPRW